MAASDYWHILSVLGTFIVTFIGTSYMFKSGGPKVPNAPKVSGFGDMAKDLVSYIPHTLILFGIIADIFTYQGVYSLTSLIGILSIVANWIFGYLWTGLYGVFADAYSVISEGTKPPKNLLSSTPPPGERRGLQEGPQPGAGTGLIGGGQAGEYFKTYDGCSIQGFTALQSKYTIQTLVVTATIMSYYMIDNLKNRGGAMGAATIIAFLVFYGAQWWAVGSCDKPAAATSGVTGAVESATQSTVNYFKDTTSRAPNVSETTKKVISLIQGLFFGGMSYIAVEGTKPTLLPSSVISPFPRKSTKDLKLGPNGTYTDDAGNPYVCFPNGQCQPDLSSAESRKAFAAIAGEKLGTGSPAIPQGCPNK